MPYELSDHLGAAGQAALGHHLIQLGEELGGQADAEPRQVGNGFIHARLPTADYYVWQMP
jgi:hypothetical protein